MKGWLGQQEGWGHGSPLCRVCTSFQSSQDMERSINMEVNKGQGLPSLDPLLPPCVA